MALLVIVTSIFLFILFPLSMIFLCMKSQAGIIKKLLWILFIILIPLLGSIAYGIIGSKSRFAKLSSTLSILIIVIGMARIYFVIQKMPFLSSSDSKKIHDGLLKPSEPIPVSADPNNAATFYLQAFNYSKLPDSQEEKDRIKQWAEKGWYGQNLEVERILRENALCLSEIDKAIPIQKCDFYFGNRQKNKPQDIPHYKNLMAFTQLVLLQARDLASKGKTNQAVQRFMAPFKMALQVSQNEDLVAPALTTAIAKQALTDVKSYLGDSKNITIGNLKYIQSTLEGFKAQLFPAKRFAELAKDDYLMFVYLTVADVKEIQWKSPQRMESKAMSVDVMIQQGHELADDYYGKIIKAAETNSEENWLEAEKYLENMKIKLHRRDLTLKIMGSNLITILTGDMKTFLENQCRIKSELILIEQNQPNIKTLTARYYEVMNDLNNLIEIVNQRAKQRS